MASRRIPVTWILPSRALARRVWGPVALSTLYTSAVFLLFSGSIRDMPKWSDEIGVINGLVLGMLVGFRTKTAYDRWWEGRCLWGDLTNQSRNLCLKAMAVARPPAADRWELGRLVHGFAYALRQHLRGPVKLQQVPGFEKETANPEHVPGHVAGMIHTLIAGWRRDGRIDGHGQQMLDLHALALMNICGGCERVRNTRLAGSYLVLLRQGLLLSFLFLPVHLIYTLGPKALFVQAVVVYFLYGVEMTAEEMEQPFGYDDDDLPLERFTEGIRKSAIQFLEVES